MFSEVHIISAITSYYYLAVTIVVRPSLGKITTIRKEDTTLVDLMVIIWQR